MGGWVDKWTNEGMNIRGKWYVISQEGNLELLFGFSVNS